MHSLLALLQCWKSCYKWGIKQSEHWIQDKQGL